MPEDVLMPIKTRGLREVLLSPAILWDGFKGDTSDAVFSWRNTCKDPSQALGQASLRHVPDELYTQQ